MSGWRTRSCGILAGIAAALTLASCGSQQQQDAQEPSGIFPVRVAASFPTVQRLSKHTRMVVLVRNTGRKAIPNVAVTITTPPYGTSVKAFAKFVTTPGLASHSRPVWVIDRPPGPCTGPYGYSCQQGGYGGAATAYANTWALGRLAPGHVARFVWGVTAVSTGTFSVRYAVAAGLNGKAKARLSGGGIPTGVFTVRIAGRPQQSFVNNSGQVCVYAANPQGPTHCSKPAKG